MKRRKPISTLRPISEINMTPLMDLTFILLITFIITFPLIEQGIPLNLPKGETKPLDEQNTRTINLDKNGQLYLNDLPMALEDLAREMGVIGRVDPDAVILLRADETIAYGRVMEVLKILNDAKVSRMALVTNPEKK
jgi:biopolymer transport protein TolR